MVVLFMIYQRLLRILITQLKTLWFCVFLLFQHKLPSQINSVRVVSALQPQSEAFPFLFHTRLEPKHDDPLMISYEANVYSRKIIKL